MPHVILFQALFFINIIPPSFTYFALEVNVSLKCKLISPAEPTATGKKWMEKVQKWHKIDIAASRIRVENSVFSIVILWDCSELLYQNFKLLHFFGYEKIHTQAIRRSRN
jgi:hypothetical protein